MTLKVHKDPPVMRPLVCCAGTFMNCWSKWLSEQFKKLLKYVPTRTTSTAAFLAAIQATPRLSARARIWTANANKMYQNILTPHAIQVLSSWIDELASRPDFPKDFHIEAVKTAMVIVMNNNYFEFGDVNLLQLIGTAMGTALGPDWATTYFGVYECKTLLPRYK